MTIKTFPPTMRVNGIAALGSDGRGGPAFWYIDTATGLNPIATVIDANYLTAEDGTVLTDESRNPLTTEPASPATTAPVNPW